MRGIPIFSLIGTEMIVFSCTLFDLSIDSATSVESLDEDESALLEAALVDRIVELTNGRPMSWKEFIELKPLSSSMTMTPLVTVGIVSLGGKGGSNICEDDGMHMSSSVSFLVEAASPDDELVECTESSVLLRIERRLSREFSLRMKPGSGSILGADAHAASKCNKDGSWVFMRFCTVRSRRNASLASFSGSISRSVDICWERFGERRLGKMKKRHFLNW